MLVHRFHRLFGRPNGIATQSVAKSLVKASLAHKTHILIVKTPVGRSIDCWGHYTNGQGVSKAQGASAEPEEHLSYHEDWMVNLRGEHWLNGLRTDLGSRKTPNECPGMLPNGSMTSLPMPRLDNGLICNPRLFR